MIEKPEQNWDVKAAGRNSALIHTLSTGIFTFVNYCGRVAKGSIFNRVSTGCGI